MRLVLPQSTLAAAAALALVSACASQSSDGDLATRDGNSDGKPLTAPSAVAPTLRGVMPIRQVMRTKNALTGSAPANAKLAYFGGQIIENPTYTNVFWGGYWTSGTGLAERNHMNSFAQTVLPTPEFLSAMIEYTGPSGKKIKTGSFAGEKMISGEPGGTTKKITNDQIRTAIDSWIQAGLVPAPTLDTLYTLHFPPGVQILLGTDGSCTAFCGYHNTVQTTRGTGGFIRYIVLPFPDCAGCNFEGTARDSLTVVYSHEAWEADTDPDVGIAIDTNADKWLGWYDNNNGENADICAGDANATMKGFRVQTTWSNAENKCVASRNVGTPTPDFTIVGTPAQQTVTAGGATSYAINVAGSNGFSAAVSFAVSGAPSGVSSTISGTVSGSGSATLNVSTTSAAAAGNSTLTITATSGSLSHSATVGLAVKAATQPDFTLGASPAAVAISAGKSGTSTVSIAATGGFNSGVTLTAAGVPSGVSASFSPASVTGSGSSTLTFTAASSAPAANATITVTGTAGALSHSASVTLKVTPAATPDFSVSVSPGAASIEAGKSGQAMFTIGASGGFGDAVALSASGAPAGVTVTPDHATITGSGTATAAIAVASSAAPGTYALSIVGASGNLRHTAAFSLTVTAPPSTSGVAFFDDGESGMSKWITTSQNSRDPQWGLEHTSAAKSGSYRFRSNAGRNYANNTATFLISKPFSLAGASKATLSFFYKFELEDSFDYFYVWASGDDGKSWTQIAEGTGTSQGWNRWAPQAHIDLSALAGKSAVRIAFSLQSDYSVTDWGVGLDDIQVTTGDTVVAGN